MGAAESAPQHHAQPSDGGGKGVVPMTPPPPKPKTLVITGPSGVGKGTLIAKLMQGTDQFGFSVSHTTRAPRPGEEHGVHYYFTTKEQFAKEIAEGKFLEYAEVHGRLYGTSKGAVQRVLDSGRVCVLDIDVQGARNVRKAGVSALFVFIAPPSPEELAARLSGRGTETEEQVQKRLANARTELDSMHEAGLYDYVIVNDNLEAATLQLKAVAARAANGLGAGPLEQSDYVHVGKGGQSSDAPGTTPGTPSAPPPTPFASQAQAQAEVGPSTAPSAALPSPARSPARSPAVSPTAANAQKQQPPAPEPQQQQQQVLVPSPARSPAVSPTAAQAQKQQQPQPQPAVAAPQPLPMPPAPRAGAPSGMEKWQGKVALVTGSSSGIGWAVCEALALAGMRVVAVARRKDRLEALQQHMMADLALASSSFLPVVCDITKEAEVATLPKIVAKRWPGSGIDVLVNNAGMSRSDASLFDGNVSSWVEMLSTNVLGTCMMTKTVVQDMRSRGAWGHIINMVGLSGHRIPDGPQGGGFYCGTKAAVKMITEGLRQEARGQQLPLRVSGISPGVVETEFFQVRAFGDPAATKRYTSQFKCLDPADIARAMLWCLSAPDHVEINDVVVRPTAQML